jgi:hypothetical protein
MFRIVSLSCAGRYAMTACVEGFGCRPIEMERRAPGPSSESRQGTNPREMVRGKCRALGYGDLSEEDGACDGSQWARGRAMTGLVGGRGRC